MALGDDGFLAGFSSFGDLGPDVLDQCGDGGHAADDYARVDLHHAMPSLAAHLLSRETDVREDEDRGKVPGRILRVKEPDSIVQCQNTG